MESVVIKCYDIVESGAMDGDEYITESRLLQEAIAVMDNETKTKFMNKLIELESKAFPDD
jgi:hypothetical protein|tara:strand:- start:555 stop:734 length:180 start_codon:yes stop_codon:yes gene_type:complete